MNTSKKFQITTLALVLFLSNSNSDIIEKINGEKHEGRIESSSDSFVVLSSEDQLFQVSHNDIKMITFQSSDLLILANDSEIYCKIVQKEFPFTVVMSESGIEKYPSLFIKRYFYNYGDIIHLKYLPRTDDNFQNNFDYSVSNFTSILKSKLRLSCSIGYSEFGEDPLQSVYSYSFSLSYPIYRTLHLGLGYSKLTYIKQGSRIKFDSDHYYTNIEYIHVLQDNSRLFPSISVDLGYMDIQTQKWTYYWLPGQLIEAESNVFYNLKLGLTYFITSIISSSLEVGWSKVDSKATFKIVQFDGDDYVPIFKEETIKLGGLNFRFAINFHLF
jgi:hypothetical protein